MGARSGAQYLERLAAARPLVHIHGETLRGAVAEHPAFAGVAATYASLYDMQQDPATSETMTFELAGARTGMSFLVPGTTGDLERRRAMMDAWARVSLGTLGRTGDYLNCALVALGAAGPWFAQADPAFARNIHAYFERVRDEDLLLTHTLITPQANRGENAAQQEGGTLTARIVREDDNGVVIRGARMLATIGPIADEMLVFPSTVLRGEPADAPYCFAIALPCDAPGVRFICRESFAAGRDRYDHPLSSRFEEMDAVVIFEDVHVPFERCFLLGHPEMCNAIYADTGAAAHMTHQVATRAAVKTEATLGLVSLLAQTIGIEQFQHVQEDIAEVIVALEIVRALIGAAEHGAELNEFGVMTPRMEPLNACRNWFPKASQRFPAILRKLGASGLMALPTHADLDGDAGAEIERYLRSATLGGADRVRLFRLAWDMSMSAFAGRQALYEYFFFGDPVRMAGALVRSYDRSGAIELVNEFLGY